MHEAWLDPGETVPTNRKHTYDLKEYNSSISYESTNLLNRKIKQNEKNEKRQQNSNFIHNTTCPNNNQKWKKKSTESAPDKISSMHLKHLELNAIKYITFIFNYFGKHNQIPDIWKKTSSSSL